MTRTRYQRLELSLARLIVWLDAHTDSDQFDAVCDHMYAVADMVQAARRYRAG